MPNLEKKILNAFQKNPIPTMPDQFAENPSSEAYEETAIFWGKKWGDLKLRDFDSSRAFSFFPEKDILYFLGALLWHSVLADNADISNDIIMSLMFRPKLKKPDSKLYRILIRATDEQKNAIVAYLRWHADRCPSDHKLEIENFISGLRHG